MVVLVHSVGAARAQDWPQFQQNAQHHGRQAVGPCGPYRARWIWCDPDVVLRNKECKQTWKDDLTGRDGYSYYFNACDLHHWWFIAPAYESWAGNLGPDCEGIGLPREVFGMVFPIERWVAETNTDTLATYMSSGPDGLGDCYWLEPLVWTIEAYGQTAWRDVRKSRTPSLSQP
jgi:hypothetical protein